MSTQWCAHPVYPSGKTKIGPKPSHPHGNRKMDKELAKFINDAHAISSSSTTKSFEESDVLCRTCYEKELSKLNLHNVSLTSIEEEYGHLDLDNKTRKQ